MDPIHIFRGQENMWFIRIFGEALIAIPDPVDLTDTVAMMELKHHRPDDGIQPRAKPTTRHNRCRYFCRFKKNRIAAAGDFEALGYDSAFQAAFDFDCPRIHDDPFTIVEKMPRIDRGNRAGNPRLT